MEGYAWNKQGLKALSQHYKTGEPLPDDLIDKMIGAKNLGVSIFWLRQLYYALFDQVIHSKEPFTFEGKNYGNSQDLYTDMKRIIAVLGDDKDTNGAASFVHIMSFDCVGKFVVFYSYLY